MTTTLLCRVRHCASIVVVAAVCAFTAVNAAAEKQKVRVGHWSWPGYGFLYVAQAKNLAPDLEFEFTVLEDPVQLFGLLSTGKLDIVLSTIEYGPIAAAQGMPVKVAGLTNLGYGSDHIIVHPDVNSAHDLKGKEVAVLEGGLSQIYMAIWLEQNGVKWNEVKMVNLIAGDAAAAMISGKVAAAELWDPFGGQVLKELKGSKEMSNSKEPYWLQLGLIADAVFVSDQFINERRDTAVAALRAMFAGVEYWRANATEANEIIAKSTGFSVDDVKGILGGENNPDDGTLYMYSLQEAARFCGVAHGDPPFGQTNGQMSDHWRLTNKWWNTFGLMKETIEPDKGVDCTLLGSALTEN